MFIHWLRISCQKIIDVSKSAPPSFRQIPRQILPKPKLMQLMILALAQQMASANLSYQVMAESKR